MAEHAVIVVGGGPTGLMLAAELALAKVDVAIVERRHDQALDAERAGGLQARSIEIMDQRGVAERFLARGQTMQIVGFVRTPLDISDFPTRHPYGLVLGQAHIEALLAGWVAELGVPTLRGVDATGFTQDAGGVAVALSDARTLRARYLVGCDGGRSLVRKTAGIDFVGSDASTSYLIAEMSTREQPTWGLRHGPRGVYALGPLDGGKRTRAVLTEAEVGRSDAPTLDELRATLVAIYGTDFGLEHASWISRFSDMARQAASYRAKRVLLAGDAAHVHSPIGGQGLNLGLQDAVNLGWKLAAVVHGTAPESLLDSYHAERHPVGARVLRTTLAQTALDRGDPGTSAARQTVTELLKMDEPRRRMAGELSNLDIHYDLGPGHPLLGRRMPDLELVTADGPCRVYTLMHDARPLLLNLGAPGALDAGPWATRVRALDARCEAPWQLPVIGAVDAPAAVLVRPDGHVAWVGDGTDRGLHDALTTWLGPGTE